MMHLLFVLLLGVSPPSTAPLEQAKTLFMQGTAKYESADYEGAIEDFTTALGIVVAENGNDRVRLTLLYNIALAHEKLFKIDKEVTHLRQARELYTRYLNFALSKGDLVEELDVETRIQHLDKQLKIYDQLQENRSEESDPEGFTPPPPPSQKDNVTWKKSRNLGIGLVAGGGAVALGGVVMAVVGSGLEDRATEQVSELADLGVPLSHPAWQQGDDFISQEARKGTALMGTGAALAISGIAGSGVGVYYLVKAKKLRENALTVTPSMSPRFAGVRISGRF